MFTVGFRRAKRLHQLQGGCSLRLDQLCFFVWFLCQYSCLETDCWDQQSAARTCLVRMTIISCLKISATLSFLWMSRGMTTLSTATHLSHNFCQAKKSNLVTAKNCTPRFEVERSKNEPRGAQNKGHLYYYSEPFTFVPRFPLLGPHVFLFN